MKKEKENDRLCFEETLKAFLLTAAGEVSLFIESLGLHNLQSNSRIGRICQALVSVIEDIHVLNRYQYVHFYKDFLFLFNLLKSTNRLDCPEEMEKLKQAIKLKMIVDCLLGIKMNIEITQQVAGLFTCHQAELPDDRLTMDQSLWGGTMALPGSEGKILVIKNLTTEQIITIITIMLNLRFGFLIHPSSVKQFVQWVLHPDTDGPKIHLGCMTNEFKCIIEHFKYFSPELSPALVGRYGLFISNLGHEITARNFSNTSYENLNTRHAIANIFDLFM